MATWHLYLLRCGDGTLYCGIALDVEARLKQHQEGKGAKYTRGRGPLELVYSEPCGTRPEALRREREVKRMPRAAKLALAAGFGLQATRRASTRP
ncbi:MAG TPA: GIY-YIG nuclease family protein [Holophagaceae bacterium]|nr:GIY-YIG nuclease family protein [Holophagaceae bacterium]